MSTGGWIALGLSVVLVGGVIYVVANRPATDTTGLEGLNNGVDTSRADLVAGLNFGGQLAQLGTSITNAISGQMARDAAAKKGSSSSSSTPPASSTGQRSSKGLIEDEDQRSA